MTDLTDRELIELAAKAAGIKGEWTRRSDSLQERWYFNVPYDNQGMLSGFEWNPLIDDGDAFRLAVKISQRPGGLALMLNSRLNSTNFAQCYTNKNVVSPSEYMKDDPFAATRRAIVRAAAELAKENNHE